MLVELRIGNFRSFNEIQTFSMEAANIKPKYEWLETDNTFLDDSGLKLKLLKTATIYGANASGKSNFIESIDFMRYIILNSHRWQAENNLRDQRFAFSPDSKEEASFFEISFILEDTMFRYGFTTNYNKIKKEWLFRTKKHERISEARMFEREGQHFFVNRKYFPEGGKKDLQDRTRENALFLSVLSQWNGPISNKLVQFFKDLVIIDSRDARSYRSLSTESLKERNSMAKRIVSMIKQFDISIKDILAETETINFTDIPDEIKNDLPKSIIKELQEDGLQKVNIKAVHNIYDKSGVPIDDLAIDFDNESDGTQKLLALSAPILKVLKDGGVLFIDELDSRFHPMICRAIIDFFHSKSKNSKNAQLIFASHNTNLLKNSIFRRDQVWFTEKNNVEATQLYSLVDFNVRNDASYDKEYISGKYGAIPYLGNFDFLCE